MVFVSYAGNTLTMAVYFPYRKQIDAIGAEEWPYDSDVAIISLGSSF